MKMFQCQKVFSMLSSRPNIEGMKKNIDSAFYIIHNGDRLNKLEDEKGKAEAFNCISSIVNRRK